MTPPRNPPGRTASLDAILAAIGADIDLTRVTPTHRRAIETLTRLGRITGDLAEWVPDAAWLLEVLVRARDVTTAGPPPILTSAPTDQLDDIIVMLTTYVAAYNTLGNQALKVARRDQHT